MTATPNPIRQIFINGRVQLELTWVYLNVILTPDRTPSTVSSFHGASCYANQAVSEQIHLGELIKSVDDGRDPADLFKLPLPLRGQVDLRLSRLKAGQGAAQTVEGGRAGSSIQMRDAFTRLDTLLHDGFNFIRGAAELSDFRRGTVEPLHHLWLGRRPIG